MRQRPLLPRFFVKVLAESIASTLIGMLVEDGLLSFDDPSPVDWLPELTVPEADPRIERTSRKAPMRQPAVGDNS